MKDDNEQPAAGGAASQGGGQGHLITVMFNGKPKEIRQGRYAVPELKEVLGVEPGYDLDQIIGGEPKTLQASEFVNVKKDDTFVSHVPRGGAA